MKLRLFILMNSSLAQEIRVYRGWGYKGKHFGVWENIKGLQISVILAFSILHFYGILINKDTNDNHTFNIFWIRLLILEVIIFNRENETYWIICDNATIHKSKLITKFLTSNNTWTITIPPYCPSLKAVEKLILSIKQKINKEIDSGK